MSERRACRLVNFSRSTQRYQVRQQRDDGLRQRLSELARQRQSFGYRRLTALLAREGRLANHKRVYRLYRDLGLSLRTKRRRRVRVGSLLAKAQPFRPNQHWAMDFVSDCLANGQKFRAFTLVDQYTRECPAIEVDTSLPSLRVIRVLERLARERGLPEEITCDNGPNSFLVGCKPGALRKACCCAILRPASRCRTDMRKALTGGSARSA